MSGENLNHQKWMIQVQHMVVPDFLPSSTNPVLYKIRTTIVHSSGGVNEQCINIGMGHRDGVGNNGGGRVRRSFHCAINRED